MSQATVWGTGFTIQSRSKSPPLFDFKILLALSVFYKIHSHLLHSCNDDYVKRLAKPMTYRILFNPHNTSPKTPNFAGI